MAMSDSQWRIRHLKRIVDERERELAERLIAPGPMCAHVSCSETHEISGALYRAFRVLRLGKFKGWRIKGVTEDGDPMVMDCASWERVLDVRRNWRRTGAQCIRFFRVYTRKREG